MKYIFLDTNIFLHCQDFEKIDWLAESATDRCKLIIPPIVVDELDEKKIGTNRIGNKSRNVLNRFEELMELGNMEIKDNVLFEVLLSKPLQKIYEENGLNFDEQDHRLIASIIDFKKRIDIGEVVLCSNDVGPRLRAKQFGINTLKLNQKYLLPNQESDDEKKIRRLEQENIALRNRIPTLSLRFMNSKEFFKYKIIDNQHVDFSVFKLKKMREIKTKYPYLEHVDPFKNPMGILGLSVLSLTPDQINSYNRRLDEFYKKWDDALDEVFEYENRQKLTFQLNLVLRNNGSCPAEDIDIHLHFPDGFDLLETDKIKKTNVFPEPPYKPKSSIDFGYSSTFKGLSALNPTLNIGSSFNLNRPTIKKTNSYDVDCHMKSLKHGYDWELESLSFIYESFSDITNFQIEYEISAGNMPQRQGGQLNVIFEK